MPKPGAVFLDRDGVINRLIYHRDAGIVDSPFTVAQFRLLPRVPKAIRLLNDLRAQGGDGFESTWNCEAAL